MSPARFRDHYAVAGSAATADDLRKRALACGNLADILRAKGEQAAALDEYRAADPLYSQLASRYEKAVVFEDGGSVTVMAVTTMPGDDVTLPVPDNTGYITEGQFYLKGGRIEPFGSLSRLKQQVNGKTRDDHRAVMDACIQLYAKCRESREKRAMAPQCGQPVNLFKYSSVQGFGSRSADEF